MLNSSTRQAPSGPVTAISSTLSTRPNPSIPPATQVYEPLVKSILARRFVYNVLSVSAAAAWLLATAWTTWQLGGVDSLGLLGGIVNWLSPLTLFCAILWWTLASAPVAVLRKVHLKATRTPTLSPHQTLLQHSTERRYQQSLLVTFISAACLAACHAIMAQTIEKSGRGDPGLGIWAGSKKHPYHLNGRFCFLFLSQFSCAISYWFRDALRSRFTIYGVSNSDLGVRAFSSLLSSLIVTLMLSATSTISSLLGLVGLRSIALPIVYRLPIIHGFLRPFVAHFLRPTYTVTFIWSDFDMIIRAFFLALSSQILWDVPSTMFDVVFSLPTRATEACKDSGLILISGIGSSEAYFLLHAFHDLCLLSSDADQMASRRAAIYGDTKYNPTLWSMLLRRSLILLGTDYRLFLRRGNPQPPLQATMTPAPKPASTENPTTPVIRTQVYKRPHDSHIEQIVESLSSDDTVSTSLTQSSSSLTEFLGLFLARLRPRMRSRTFDVAVSDVSKFMIKAVTTAPGLGTPLQLRMEGITVWWTRERRDKAAQKALPNKELDVMIVNVLSRLVSHSLREDALGYVQRDIPRVLEAMVLFLSATESYQIELSGVASAMGSKSASDNNELIISREEIALASEWVEDLSMELRTGISLIVKNFGDRLAKFKFPPNIAATLQTFVNYST